MILGWPLLVCNFALQKQYFGYSSPAKEHRVQLYKYHKILACEYWKMNGATARQYSVVFV